MGKVRPAASSLCGTYVPAFWSQKVPGDHDATATNLVPSILSAYFWWISSARAWNCCFCSSASVFMPAMSAASSKVSYQSVTSNDPPSRFTTGAMAFSFSLSIASQCFSRTLPTMRSGSSARIAS